MAIQILNDFDPNKLYSCFQNIIIEFESDNTSSTVSHAILGGFDYEIKLQPIPDSQKFWINIKAHVKNMLIKNNLKHNYALGEDVNDLTTFRLDITEEYLLQEDFVILVYFDDSSIESYSFSLKAGLFVNNLFRFNEQDSNFYTAHPANVKYWEGLPFSLSFIGDNVDYTIQSQVVNQSISVPTSGGDTKSAYRYTFDNGQDILQINSQAFLSQNINKLFAIYPENNLTIELIDVHKISDYCPGPYFKWLNQKGGWSYFMFSDNNELINESENIGSINNDFQNYGQNSSPQLQIGKKSFNKMTVVARKASVLDREILNDLIDSPKIYYYTAEPNTQSSLNDWIEVKLISDEYENRRLNVDKWDIVFEFEFQKNYTQTI